MGMVESLTARHDTEASNEQGAALTALKNPPGGILAAINAVAVTGPQMKAAIEAIRHIVVRTEADAIEHAILLSRYAAERRLTPAEFAGPALHARAIAMDRWCARYDPLGQTDVEAFFEAAARAPLVGTQEGLTFEPVAFGELIEFVARMPY